ncbi:hypothetical protein SeLEV6574_g03687 [Synchytrium endobioticum]|uniref:Uncharacterized protein n=1 Tax=Synchytrium endobioticum TaxID=286115 RepID=A0A507D372_9FUNG|nr:hypothetical protein SeLEV6574_g03687 [Synchytrium endobioticum]
MSKLNVIFLLMLGVYCLGTSADLTDQLEADLAATKAKVIEEVADIQKHRRLYDVHFALYLTSSRGLHQFFLSHGPNYGIGESDEEAPQVLKYLNLMDAAWLNVWSIIILNIYKYHDLCYPNEPLLPRTRHELLQRWDMVEAVRRTVMSEADERHTLDWPVLDDDGRGFISNAKDAYVGLRSEMENVKDVIKMEAEKLLLYVERRIPPLTSRQLDWVVEAFKLDNDVGALIKSRVMLITKTKMDEMFEILAELLRRISPSDTSLEYLILRNDCETLLLLADTYAMARETAATLDFNDEDAAKALTDDIAVLVNSMNVIVFGDFVSERGGDLYQAIEQERETGYVAISDDLLNEYQLKPIPELIARLVKHSDISTLPVDDVEPHRQEIGIESVENASSAEPSTALDVGISDYELIQDNIMHQRISSSDPLGRDSSHVRRFDGPGSSGLRHRGSRSGRGGASGSTASSSRIDY